MQYHSREQAARETAERICSGGGTAEIFSADISREDEVEALFDAAESRLGFLGVLVNNAAISQKGLFTLKGCFVPSPFPAGNQMRA